MRVLRHLTGVSCRFGDLGVKSDKRDLVSRWERELSNRFRRIENKRSRRELAERMQRQVCGGVYAFVECGGVQEEKRQEAEEAARKQETARRHRIAAMNQARVGLQPC